MVNLYITLFISFFFHSRIFSQLFFLNRQWSRIFNDLIDRRFVWRRLTLGSSHCARTAALCVADSVSIWIYQCARVVSVGKRQGRWRAAFRSTCYLVVKWSIRCTYLLLRRSTIDGKRSPSHVLRVVTFEYLHRSFCFGSSRN